MSLASIDSEKNLQGSDSKEPLQWEHKRSIFTKIPFLPTSAPAARNSLDDAKILPDKSANFFSVLTFGWLSSLLALGYARPLEAPDLYKLQDDRGAASIGRQITASYERRKKEAQEYNARLANGQISPGWRVVWWTLQGKRTVREQTWRNKDGRKKASLTLALNDSVKWWFWSGGILKVISDTAQISTALLVKEIIRFATNSYVGRRTGSVPIPPVGKGIGLTFGLFAIEMVASLCVHHFFYRSTSTGVLLRGGLIHAIYARSLRLTSKARSSFPNGLIMNHISTDVSRIDFCAGFFHMSWSAPIQLAICLVLLLLNLGPSALAGFSFFIVATPILSYVMKKLFALRAKSMVWTDKRAKLLQELLGGMKVIKFFAWEAPFLKRIAEYRRREMSHIRSLLLIRAATNAVATSMPVLASVLAFVTYAATGHELRPDIIFASLTLFNLLRLPLMFLPMSFSSITDALNAIERLTPMFDAEVQEDTYTLDESLDVALEVKGASFTWDSPPPNASDNNTKTKSSKEKRKSAKLSPAPGVDQSISSNDNVFKLDSISLSVPRGQLVAIVGPVGSGKSSLLQAVIGEMRRTSGTVKFGGSVAYCSQSAWIQNATIRENICFGRPFDEGRYWKAIRDSCLEPDLALLQHGDLTEVGERGISLSGGQKQRLNITRAIYCDADVQIFDDPLSALDAHVGKAVFHNVLQNTLAGKTRILVTHALHFLSSTDYIYVVAEGKIAERGTFIELMENNGEFAKFLKEFGSSEDEAQDQPDPERQTTTETPAATRDPKIQAAAGPGMMQSEERNTGSISWSVYRHYASAGKGFVLIPILLISLVMVQGATVMSSYWLVFWQEVHFPRPSAFYMGVYAALGISQAVAFFIMGATFALFTYFSSQQLHRGAIGRVLHAPMSFFETTPLGRIMNRFSKDIDTVDSVLGDSLRMFVGTFSAIIGAIILISIILPWFLLGMFGIMFLYYYAATFYRSSARELKRLDAVLRSSLYSHFSESLSGLSTIRAYAESERFLFENERRIDIENRAYWLTVTNQRWLGIRLDFLGSTLTFIVAILTVAARFSISPSQTGVTLAYILSVQQTFGWMVRQSAEVENNMNSVERITHYSTEIEQEAPYEIPAKQPKSPWPSRGKVEFRDVVLHYRPGLPPVLKGITLDIHAGEKVGIVGRTGAGKSSLMTALYRIVELDFGSILIDDVDISTIGLSDLRNGLSIIPQEPLLFSGTLRSNLDPFNLYDDATLWDALKRSYLVDILSAEPDVSPDKDDVPSRAHTPVNRFSLDTVIEDEGGNLSVGQRSLVSLARALVRNTRIIVLDEATASVDYETDRNIQATIAREFQDRTILCIAHRLKTIISYDRICVLDAGIIAEFDTPENLFKQEGGIFRTMCEQSSITLEDVQRAHL